MEPDIEHPTKVKSWNIYANGSENKWEVHAVMKCTATVTHVQLTWNKYCIVYGSIANGVLLLSVLAFWLEFVAP